MQEPLTVMSFNIVKLALLYGPLNTTVRTTKTEYQLAATTIKPTAREPDSPRSLTNSTS